MYPTLAQSILHSEISLFLTVDYVSQKDGPITFILVAKENVPRKHFG